MNAQELLKVQRCREHWFTKQSRKSEEEEKDIAKAVEPIKKESDAKAPEVCHRSISFMIVSMCIFFSRKRSVPEGPRRK
jgi:hypothetical protein